MLPRSTELILGLDGIQDPANVGVILRSFLAFGGREVVLMPGTASPYSAKALRASSGAAHLLFFRLRSPATSRLLGPRKGGPSWDCPAHQGEPPRNFDARQSCMLFVGSEGHGLWQETEDCLDGFVRIPMPGGTESLNAAVAASIVLYELSLQAEVPSQPD